jgi:hypothetical protein
VEIVELISKILYMMEIVGAGCETEIFYEVESEPHKFRQAPTDYTVNGAHLFTNICLGSTKFNHLIYRDPNVSLETSEYPEENKFMFG